jgi:MYXO-CTERM domain-containing protein
VTHVPTDGTALALSDPMRLSNNPKNPRPSPGLLPLDSGALSRVRVFATLLAFGTASLFASTAFAQGNAGDQGGECTGGLCGTPNQSGGGCSCSCGCSILINRTDVGNTYQYADDYDNDGIEDDFDNCPFVPNADQADGDGDGIGDQCDNCARVSNRNQGDIDGDGQGDLCDLDMDNDGIPNEQDNCPLIANPSQKNVGGDTVRGDACDPDADGDGIPNAMDPCPLDPRNVPGSATCHSDDDSDGVPDDVDNCPGVRNFEQGDVDHDGVGDVCDGDMDGDIVANPNDNCPRHPNPDQKDSDRDGLGDLCDDRDCYVIDRSDTNHCLDVSQTFTVLSLPSDTAPIGEPHRLHIFANRENVAMRYTWSIISRPKGSSDAKILNPRGSVTYSNSFEYRYLKDQVAEFVADQPGDYEVQLSAELVFPDAKYPDINTSRTSFKLTATDSGKGGGCVCTVPQAASGGGLLIALFGVGLVLTMRARRRGQETRPQVLETR